MTEQNFNLLFAKNLRSYLSICNMSQVELAKRLGVGTTSVYNWCNGVKVPRMDKVDKMCEIFSCKRSDLITDVPAPVAPAAEPCDFTPLEKEIVKRYRVADEYDQMSVLRTLHIEKGDFTSIRESAG